MGIYINKELKIYNPELAQQWFRSPVKGLRGKTPLEFADTEPGAQEVESMLDRIEDGVFY
jgi:uncharacterized protein (DUF2384 family)